MNRLAGSSDASGREAAAVLVLCGAVVVGSAIEQAFPNLEAARSFAPSWLPPVAAGLAAAGILALARSPRSRRPGWVMSWAAVLLLVWVANGLPFDVLTAAGLIGHRTASGAVVLSSVYWPGLATRACALGAALVLARRTMSRPVAGRDPRPGAWYGYAAFVLALPYPVLRVHWALGGTIGLGWPGAAGQGWEPVLIAIPWMAAAGLSLLLASPPPWFSRRLLIAAGWAATVIVAMIGPSALWALISDLASGAIGTSDGIATWVFALFYGSWFLWAVVGAAATRSCQVRSAARPLAA